MAGVGAGDDKPEERPAVGTGTGGDTNEEDVHGAVSRKCTKCKRPTRGHSGPYGANCEMNSEDEKENGKRKHPEDETDEQERNKRLRIKLQELKSQEEQEDKRIENE